MEETNIITKKSGFTYLNSIFFLVVVVIVTISLHFYNNSSLNEIENIKEDIAKRQLNIDQIKKGSDLQIYSLLELNKEVINSYNNMNKITKYINHMNVLAGKYNLELSGFNMSNGEIKTNVRIISDSNGIAFQKTKNFISKYRKDRKALFDLDFLNEFEGMDEIKFRANFIIK